MKRVYMISLMFFLGAVFFAPSLVSAAPRPELYPNKHFKSVGPTRARKDIVECQIRAEDYLGENATVTRQDSARATTRSAARGAAMGALAGAIKKDNVGRSLGAGAALGGLSGVMRNRKKVGQATPEYTNFVEACLDDLGYKVIRWN